MAASQRPRVFLDVSIGEQPAGRLVIELFTDKTPRTCENFRQFCTGEHDGLSYAKSPFHRVIDEFMVQGGDIDKGDGTGTTSIYGSEFEDENLNWRELDAAGLVCSANRGKDTNGSQFFVTLEPCAHLNGKHTIFGRLVAGEDVLARIAKVDVDKDDRPHVPVLVSRCGELERKRKQDKLSDTTAARSTDRRSADRGRRRKSIDSDEDMKNSPEPPPAAKGRRRQSDNVVDEGLRGRPRQRSRSRSRSRSRPSSQALSTPEESMEVSDAASPTRKHKRKRSPSPSRHQDGQESHGRRRRSLPNQYDAMDRRDRRGDDSARYRPYPRRDDRRHDNRYDGHGPGDHYRPSKRREEYDNHGRLGDSYLGHDRHSGQDPPVKFKGRGIMKYREPGRL